MCPQEEAESPDQVSSQQSLPQGAMEQCIGSAGGQKWLNSGFILKVETSEFVDPKVFGLNNLEEQISRKRLLRTQFQACDFLGACEASTWRH